MRKRFHPSSTRGVCAACLVLAAVAAEAQTLTKISVSPSPALVGKFVPVPMRAYGTYSNGTVMDITSQVTWSLVSGQSGIGAKGLLTAVASGSDTVQAALGTVQGTAPALAVLNTDNQTVTATIPVGQSPIGAAINPLTNKIYVANQASNNVTVIDGATNTTTTIAAGTGPSAIAVNPVTNRIYVTNQNSNNVTVIDGGTGATTTVGTGNTPSTLAVNPVSNQIFVLNHGGITIIDGATNNTIPISLSSLPIALAVNPATNYVYVTTFTGSVAIVNGATDSLSSTTINLGTQGGPLTLLAVDPTSNAIYAGTPLSNAFAIIDGNTNELVTPNNQFSGGVPALNPSTHQVVFAFGGVTVYDPATNTGSPNAGILQSGLWVAAAMNAATGQAYVVSNQANTIGILDGANGYLLTSTLSSGAGPNALTVNPLTNKVYVVNQGSNNVTVVDGASNQTTKLSTGTTPSDAQVNPITNTIYFVNSGSNNVTVVDGATNNTVTVPVGSNPAAAAVNSLTNKIYVANQNSNNVTVIDGATNATSTVPAGSGPFAVIANPMTNQIYVANADGTVTIVDGATNATTAVNDGITGGNHSASPFGMALNPVTNKLYLPNFASGSVAVIDGTGKAVSTIAAGARPFAIAVNSITNQIYVANLGSQNLTVIDGATALTSTLPLPIAPWSVGVNRVTNLIYVAGIDPLSGLTTIAVIDPSTNPPAISTIASTFSGVPSTLAVDEITNKIYFSGIGIAVLGLDGETNTLTLQSDPVSGGIAEAVALGVNPNTHRVYSAFTLSAPISASITEELVTASPLNVSVTPLPGNRSNNPQPSFTLNAADGLDPSLPPLQNVTVYYRFDSREGPWTAAAPNQDGGFGVTPGSPLQPGMHTLLVFATDGREGTMSGTSLGYGNGDGPLVSPVAAYTFYVLPPPLLQSITIAAPYTSVLTGAVEQLTATAQFSDGTSADVTNTATWSSSAPSAAAVGATGILTAAGTGTTTITAAFDGVSGTQAISCAAPVYLLRVTPSITNSNGNYVVQLTLANQGNVPVVNIDLTLIQLNSTTGTAPTPIPSLAPNASAAATATIPVSAGTPETAALLRVAGTYTATIPGGPAEQTSIAASFRLILP